MLEKTLCFSLVTLPGTEEVQVRVCRLLLGGLSGRNPDEVRRHLDELEVLGIPAPRTIPVLMRVSVSCLTSSRIVEVQGEKTSGEVEYVLLYHQGRLIVTVGSDQSDFELEKTSAKRAKQIAPKILCPQAWDYEEIKDHWDELVLRSWVEVAGRKVLYQQGELSTLLPPEDLVQLVRKRVGLPLEETVLYSGTIPTINGVQSTRWFWLELQDPVLKRKLAHSYQIEAFPGYY